MIDVDAVVLEIAQFVFELISKGVDICRWKIEVRVEVGDLFSMEEVGPFGMKYRFHRMNEF